MGEWIKIEPESLGKPETKMVSGVEIRLLVSPYDLPQQVRGMYDDAIKKFVIDFSYLDSEETKTEKIDKYLTAFAGKNSGRLYKIQIDVDALKVQSVQLNLGIPQVLSTSIDQLRSSYAERGDNYDAVNKVIAAKQNELFRDYPQHMA
jgi:hypothetical protein